MAKKMKIAGLTVDPSSNVPIVLLHDETGEDILPIWIGILEASSIATQLENIELARPMTHDLFASVLKQLGARITKIVINDLNENTYFARISLADREGRIFEIDARPSDSIAMALRAKADIYVEESVLEKAQRIDKKTLEEQQKTMEEKWKEFLENIDPDDLGKYRM